MQNVSAVTSAVIGLVGTVLVVVVPLLMLGCLLFLFGARSKSVLSPEGRRISLGMVISHFAGFGLFVAANAIPVSLQPLRVLVAGIAILLLGVLPSVISLVLIRRQMIPERLHAFGWFVAGATGLLSLILVYVVRIADLALRVTSSP